MLKSVSELYAISQGAKCRGDDECHWCGSPCDRRWIHDDPPQIPFTKKKTTARRPGNLWICVGCWMYRMQRITVSYLDNTFKDRQSPQNHSWLITEEEARSIRSEDFASLYTHLLNPPLRFSLSLISDPITPNLIQLQELNYHDKIQADSKLSFTLDNIPHTYTIYELEEGLKHGSNGKMPGVQALIRYLGPFPIAEVKRGRGRPRVEDRVEPERILKRVVKQKE